MFFDDTNFFIFPHYYERARREKFSFYRGEIIVEKRENNFVKSTFYVIS